VRVVKVTSKGQVTIPVELRAALGIDQDSYLEVLASGDEIRLRKIRPTRPLSGEDPIWELLGSGESGGSDAAEAHDERGAEGEMARWRESS
jgi:AbrB family looped-hinge helix DNA binding protein